MTVLSSSKDLAALTMTIISEFDADVDRVWQLWADPRKLEAWWGPPEWPATFTRHDFTVGGESRYHMTGPDGEQPGGYWRMTSIEPPTRLTLEEGFTDEAGNPLPEEPMGMELVLAGENRRTRMTITYNFASTEQLDAMVAMGMEEGMTLAIGQIDALLNQVPADLDNR